MARILICDEDVRASEVWAATVAAEGHEAVVMQRGDETLDAASAGMPDLVLLDENSPVFDGYELCRMLRADPTFPPTLPIILLAAEEPNPYRMEAAGFTAYFLKERSSSDLQELLVEQLGPLANPYG